MKVSIAIATAVWVSLCGAALAYEGGTVTNGGTITGVVKFQGTPPAAKKLSVDKDKAICAKGSKVSEDLVVSSNKGIRNAVVSLSDIKKGAKLEVKKTPVLDQQGCVYVPHVLLVPAGASVDVLNNDGILHNIHTYPTQKANQAINKAQPKFKKKMEIEFQKPELIKVQCDVHGWMSAWIVVHDNPYYSVTNDKGEFTLTNVPPGTYTLEVWQESLGKKRTKVTVKGKGEVKVSLELGKKA